RDHATAAGEPRDLELPCPRVDDRPRRQEDHGRLLRPVDLVERADTVAIDESLLVGVACSRLLSGGSHALRHDAHRVDSSQASIQSSSACCPCSMPESRSSMIPSLKVATSDTRASSGMSMPCSSRACSNASVSTACHSAVTLATRSRSSGWFQASACSSYQTFWYSRSSSRYRMAWRHFSMKGVGSAYISRCRAIKRSVNRSSTRTSRLSIEPK